MKKYFLVLPNGECVSIVALESLPYSLVADALTNNMAKDADDTGVFLPNLGVDILDPNISFQFN
jgi:hypothetical protein